MTHSALKAVLALLGGCCGGAVVLLLARVFGHPVGPIHYLPPTLIAALLSMFMIDTRQGGPPNWLVYAVKCALFAFLLSTLQVLSATAF